MDNIILGEKVSDLEALFGHFLTSTGKSLNRLSRQMEKYREEGELDRKQRDKEMKEFKDEMKEFKDEMKEFKDEMKEFKDEMKEFKDEMKEFKDEMKTYKLESEKDRKNMNKQWGELANKMGTVVEDIISPAVRPVIQKYFDDDIIDFSLNRKKHDKSLNLKGEFDVIAVSSTRLYLVEVKSSPRPNYLDMFSSNIEKFKKLFPEYSKLELVPIFASLRFEPDFIETINSYGFYAMAYREWEYMDILNFEEIQKSKV